MTVPGVVQIINAVLLSLINFDILYTDEWLSLIFYAPYETGTDSEPLNSLFDENGYKSKLLIKNLGSTFVFLAMYLGIWAITCILYVLGKM